MSFPLLVRRIYLYAAMFLLPWFLVYGFSSVPFSHNDWFRDRPQWAQRFDRPYDLPVAEGANLREVGARILLDSGLQGSFGASRRQQEINVYRFDFWSATQITYYLDQKRLLAKDRGFRWASFLTGMHARGGFHVDVGGGRHRRQRALARVIQRELLLVAVARGRPRGAAERPVRLPRIESCEA